MVFEVSTKSLLEVFRTILGRPGPPFECPKAPKVRPKPPTDPPRAPFGAHFDVFWRYFSALEPKEVNNTILESFWLHFGSKLIKNDVEKTSK